MLLAFVVLLAASTLASTLALRQILLARVGERVEEALVQEVDEFEALAEDGRDPRNGEPFGDDVKGLFDVFLLRNVPTENEAIYTFVDGELYESTRELSGPRLRERVLELGAVRRAERGEVETTEGTVRYLAVPIADGNGRRRGVFVVAVNLGQERDEVVEAVQTAAGVSIGVLLIASALAWVIAGRVLAPLRTLRTTAQAITESDLTQRLDVHGDDEIAELGRTFNAMLDRLEAAFASQRAFVSDAGHELRTPITIVRGHLELLGDDPLEREETVALVTDELDRMARFVEDLLLLAKAEQGDFLHVAPLDLDVLTDELYNKAKALADRDWRLVGQRHRPADRGSPAAHAGRHAARAERGRAHARRRPHLARLRDRTTASRCSGSPTAARASRPASASEIFERFHRGGDGRRRSDGAGLGLSIVRAIAEAHGGRVELDSRRGRGRHLHPDRPDRAAPGGRHDMNRILIVEDEPRLASFLEKGLRANGFTTTTVHDGYEATVRASDAEFDLMVLDLGLPGKDGLSVLRDVRAGGNRMPVVILSARDDTDVKVTGLERGADDYVTKPFRFEELLARVRVRLRDGGTPERTVLEAGDVVLDLRTRRASVDGESIELSAREFTMLEVFLRHPGQVLSREQLLSHVWGYDHDPGSNVVDVYVGYLRRKLGKERIVTVRGMGYALHT